MLWRLCNNVTDIVKTFSSGAPCNLVKISCGQNGCLVSAVLAELRKENCADRDVYAYAERVRSADNFQKPLLSELFAENAVFGQKPRVVEPNALFEPTLDIRAVWACKADFLDGFVYRLFLFLGAQVEAHEVLRIGSRCRLRKVDHIDGRLALVYKFLHFGRDFGSAVAKVEWHRALRRADSYGLAARMLGHVAFEKFGGANGRAHQEESRLRER